MSTIAIEMCDVGFQAASWSAGRPEFVPTAGGAGDWPGFAYYDGRKFSFGRAAEDQWFVHPRQVTHGFWSKLAHEPSPLGPTAKPARFSELAFHFLREFTQRVEPLKAAEKVVLAVPGGYLKDAAAEDEKIGLLLGMAGELKLPLAGIVDSACAALCDPRIRGLDPTRPVVVLDLQLESADFTLVSADGRIERKGFVQQSQVGYVQVLKHLVTTMGNRFLRHTAFDILENGALEQAFFRQTKEFLWGGAVEHHYRIATATRAYEMVAKRDKVEADLQGWVTVAIQGLHRLVGDSPHASRPMTIALTDRAAHLPGLETRLRSSGFGHVVRLPLGAAACGAACVGEQHLKTCDDLADVPVQTLIPLTIS